MVGIVRTDRGRHVLVTWEGPSWGGQAQTPARITGHDDLQWVVDRVIESWQHPDVREYGKVNSEPGAPARVFRLAVTGPIPGQPGATGSQEVALISWGDGAGWYLTLA
jgi:hypothetical protein